MLPPAKEIIGFIKRQPEAIQGDLCFHVVGGFYDLLNDLKAMKAFTADPMLSAQAVLDVGDDSFGLQRAALAVGALDFAFALDREKMARIFAVLPEIDDLPMLKKAKLAAPLNIRFLDKAQSQWARLRESTLSYSALHELQTALAFDQALDR